jgi:hypothetical protein
MPSKPNENRLLALMALGELETFKEVRLNNIGELLDDLHRRQMEDQYDLKLADRSMKEMRRGGFKAIPIDVMIKSIDRKIFMTDVLSI